MMKHGQFRIVALSVLCSICAAVGCVAGAVTYAGYVTATDIVRTISSGGKPKKSIFLNANIWETDGPTYFLYAKKDNGAETKIETSKRITPTIGGNKLNLCVFEYDDVAFNKIKFQRFNSRYYGETAKLAPEASSYRLIKKSASWNYATGISFYQDEKDSNHYVANHVSLTSEDQVLIRSAASDFTDYRNQTAGTHYTVVDNNIQISESATYTIDFYVSATNNNHVVFLNEGNESEYVWNESAWISDTSSINYYCIKAWNNDSLSENNEIYLDNGVLRFRS